MTDKYICNKAGDKLCQVKTCLHRKPHLPKRYNFFPPHYYCNDDEEKWNTCGYINKNGKDKERRVRCVKVKG